MTSHHWRPTQSQDRAEYLRIWDGAAAENYFQRMGSWTPGQLEAFTDDLQPWLNWQANDCVLDCGAGTGMVAAWLQQWSGIAVTALEPSPSMLQVFQRQPELQKCKTVCGFTDAPQDRIWFSENHFQAIIARQSVNHLFDPFSAFQNWYYWLRPQGNLIVVDGTFFREDWAGPLESCVDSLPMSANQSLATVPYLLELAGFQIRHVGWMEATNRLPVNRRPKWITVAQKPDAGSRAKTPGNEPK